jgi:hypothetical protein
LGSYTYWVGTPDSGSETWASRDAGYTGDIDLSSVTIDAVQWAWVNVAAGDTFTMDRIQISRDAIIPNTAPTWTATPVLGTNAYVDVAYSDTLAGDATDADGDTLTYSLVTAGSWLNVATNGAMTGTPLIGDLGTNTLSVRVDDGNGGIVTNTLEIIVDNVPTPPTWSSASFTQKANGGTEFDEGQAELSYLNWRVSNPASNAFTIAIVSGPSWLSVENAVSGKIVGTPAAADCGENVFIVSVTDGISAADEATMTIQVVPATASGYYAEWTNSYSVVTNGLQAEDADGDGVKNVVEYALGGDPLNASDEGTGYPALLQAYTDGGSVKVVYPKRNDAAARGLTYYLETSDLLNGAVWTNVGYQAIGTNVLDASFNAVTNQIPTDVKATQFFRLKVEQQ